MFGFTSSGFVSKRFEDCEAELKEVFREILGEDADFDAYSQVGQLLYALSLRESDAWAQLQAGYLATKPDTAEGVYMDDVFSINNLTRLPATYSIVNVCLRGEDTDVVAAGFKVSDLLLAQEWELLVNTTISRLTAIEVVVKIDAAAAGDYVVTIDGTAHTYTATGTPTVDGVVNGLFALLSAALGTDFLLSKDLDSDTITVKPSDLATAFSAALTGDLSFDSIGTLGIFQCTETGKITAPANSLLRIVTPDTPTSVINFLSASPGRDVETDFEFRLRRDATFLSVNGATIGALETRVQQEVDNVSFCKGFQNLSSSTDEYGRPPHAVEMVVSNGDTSEIAQKIYDVKAAGVPTYGNTSVGIVDSLGQVRTIYFSRPVTAYVWVEIMLTHDYETVFPLDGEAQIRDSVVNYGNENFPLGRDLINEKFKIPVHDVTGVRSAAIRLATTVTPAGSPTYSSGDVLINPTTIPDFDSARITIIEA